MDKRIVRLTVVLAVIAALGLAHPHPGRACSTFVMAKDGRVYFGRNFDFFTGIGFLTTNPRGMSKTALVVPGNPPARWTSKYGSVTFNQVGREFPMGGMNEKGLVVECLWLVQTRYPAADPRPTLTELQWIQYQLDNCQSVDEVIANDAKIRILPSATKLHFQIADRAGRAGIVEFIDGRSVLYGPDKVLHKALTNSPFQNCLEALTKYREFGGREPLPDSLKSQERFARMAARLKGLSAGRTGIDAEQAFQLLKSVRYDGAESPTQWSIVYDPVRLEIQYETRDRPVRRSVRFADFDFRCGGPVKILDLDEGSAGNVAGAFKNYSSDVNRKQTRKIFELYKNAKFITDLPEIAILLIGAYPETTQCGDAAHSRALNGEK